MSWTPPLRWIDHRMQHALLALYPTVSQPANVPLPEAFNWRDIAASLPPRDPGDWYIVAFRSTRRRDADAEALYAADAAAHAEAWDSGGLLKYYYGELQSDQRCLAMCVWAHTAWAEQAAALPLHQHAVRLAAGMYDSYTLERYRLVKGAGACMFRFETLPAPPRRDSKLAHA